MSTVLKSAAGAFVVAIVCCRTSAAQCTSPLILNLEGGDTVEVTSILDPVLFDLTGSGVRHEVAWTPAAREEGFLWIDLNHDGVVNGGQELFGNATVLIATGGSASNGFEALAQYDRPELGGNGDGVISGEDQVWGRLRVWIDRNHDGVMQHDEDYALSALGIVSIRLDYVFTSFALDGHANAHPFRSTFERRDERGNASPGVVEDVFLRRKQ